MLIILKTIGGLETNLSNGKTILLKGCSIINNVDDSLWLEAKKSQTIQHMLDNGFIVENSTKSENGLSDTLGNIKSKQDKDIKQNKKANKAEATIEKE